MIKVQPAHSRIRKTETPDRITLEMPPRGLLSGGGALLFLAFLWIVGTILGAIRALTSTHPEFGIFAGIAMVPGLLVLFAGAAMGRRSWWISRSAERVHFEKQGLFGSTRRTWDALDVASVYSRREN